MIMFNNNLMAAMSEIMRRYDEFKRTFQGAPREKIQELLNSGAISQDMLNQAQAMAKQLAPFMKK